MSNNNTVGAFLLIAGLLFVGAILADEASKIYCETCRHKHKPNDQHIWEFP